MTKRITGGAEQDEVRVGINGVFVDYPIGVDIEDPSGAHIALLEGAGYTVEDVFEQGDATGEVIFADEVEFGLNGVFTRYAGGVEVTPTAAELAAATAAGIPLTILYEDSALAALVIDTDEVEEGSAAETIVGTISGFVSLGDVELTDDGSGAFVLDGADLVVLDDAIDFESTPTIDIELTETNPDYANSPRTTPLTITVTDVDEIAPTITSANAADAEENAVLAHALTANEAVTWSIVGGADQALFEIDGSTLRWDSDGTQDFETPLDANTDNAYVVQVRATDGAANTANQTITITVTDVEEGGLTEFAYADFDTGTYRLNGAPAIYGDLFSGGTVGAATHTTGNALVSGNPEATAALTALLLPGGFGFVIDYASDSGATLSIEIREPDWVLFWNLNLWGDSELGSYEILFTTESFPGGTQAAVDTDYRLAGRMTSAGMAASWQGGAATIEAGPPGDWADLVAFQIWNNGDFYNVKKLIFYSPPPDGDLPTLSTP